jgi:hypothetical protein
MAQHASVLLIVTAIVELATGICLLILPSLVIELLFGIQDAAAETMMVARFAGAALAAFGIAAWSARSHGSASTMAGTVTAALVYDLAAAAILAYSASSLHMIGIALWPGVILHCLLAVWCIASLATRRALPASVHTNPH